MNLLRLPCNLIRYALDKAMDHIFGAPEDFTYESRTAPEIDKE